MEQKVIIVGGGLAGLLLANGLKKNNIPFEVYERDLGEDTRAQGWSLSLHFAIQAIKECMPESSFENFTEKVTVSQGKSDDCQVTMTMVNGNTNEVVLSETYEKDSFYRIERHRFRNWLLEPVKESVHWGKRLVRFEETGESVTAFFEDGTTAMGTLLVAADGAQSKITKQVVGDAYNKLTYVLPLHMLGTSVWVSEEDWLSVMSNPNKFLLVATTFDESVKEAQGRKGNLSCFSSLQTIDKTRKDKPYKILFTMAIMEDEDVFPKTLNKTNEERLALMRSWLKLGLNKNSIFHKLVIEDLDASTEISEVVIREREPSFEAYQTKHHRVVLVGDAAHPMSMFRGEGMLLFKKKS
ncbi:FAD-dependent urate hydroxylase [Choanephora cucurbitarum]|uniref:FAD-dependent urate hydroxylase n=1 Tax=Choanephora cucurbitarum TaxID=101091 RepID=A0A1C7MYN8_9FUNG|nr:FAD-dependent urate hydroxylase [Choanephora cucurbitarum]